MAPDLVAFPPPPGSPAQVEGTQSPPPASKSNINVAFINCVGQTRFALSKQLEIQNYMRSHNIDILHLQECKIDDESFSECQYVRSNFNIFTNNTKNNTCYGTASLVRSDLDVTNLRTDEEGRIIVFDAAGCSWANIYLPSGTDGASRSLRENYCAQILPQLLLPCQKRGAAGGDFNSIISLMDSNRNAAQKISPSLKTLVSSFAWSDSYRCIYPRTTQYSRIYSNAHHGEGASRIDRCYHWGDISIEEAEYSSISFSDHLSLRLIYTLPLHLKHVVAPQAKASFKIPPEVVDDDIFRDKLGEALAGWHQVREPRVDPLKWWQYLVKLGILHLAKSRYFELKKQRCGQLNLLSLRQAYLGAKVRGGDTSAILELTKVNLQISKWYEDESRRVILLSRASDINSSEKVRIYHHALHRKFINKSSILKLETPSGVVEGHENCALALENNVAAHLLHPAPLDPLAQAVLLSEVDTCFSTDDNAMLMESPTMEEVKKVLFTCRSHAAPGTDGITAYFYKKHWNMIGSDLTDVIVNIFNGAAPTDCQRTSLMVFGNKPGKKAKSLKISDRRKLSLMNVDFKIATGIEASRLRCTMRRTISPHQLVTGGDRRISHGVALARDAIQASSSLKSGCGILDTDLIAAFCNMTLPWCLLVMKKKGIDEKVINRYLNLYRDNYSIVVVNNIKGRCIKNVRMSVRQGDKFAMEIFSFGMDPVLTYLERRLEGILIHSLPVQGPVLDRQPPPPPPLPPPPVLAGLAALPPRPPPLKAAARLRGRGDVFSVPTSLPPLETRYKIVAFCDDLKPAITSIYEFLLVERVMTIFERSSGCSMHRQPGSLKCKFLPLAKWRKSLTQEMIPFDFFTISDHLDFLGVTLMATYTSSRKSNGEILQERVRKTIGAWKAGRFMPLNLRSHSVNCFAYSKLYYRCNVIGLRVEDSNFFASQAKSFIYADMLEKPQVEALYRAVSEGGLGLYSIRERALAALMFTFLQTAASPQFRRNHYHHSLYLHHVLEKSESTPLIPPYFQGDFFPTLRKLRDEKGSLEYIGLRDIYNFLMTDVLRTVLTCNQAERPLAPLRCELANPAADWKMTWHRVRLRGLGPELTSFLLKLTWGILPCKARVAKIIPRNNDPGCRLCGIPETVEHALLACPANQGAPQLLLAHLRTYSPNLRDEQVLTLDFEMDDYMELALTWLAGTFFLSLWNQRQAGKVCPHKIRAELEAKCRLLREGKGAAIQNALTLASIALSAMYRPV